MATTAAQRQQQAPGLSSALLTTTARLLGLGAIGLVVYLYGPALAHAALELVRAGGKVEARPVYQAAIAGVWNTREHAHEGTGLAVLGFLVAGVLRHGAHTAGTGVGTSRVGGRSPKGGTAHGSPTLAHGGLGRMEGMDDAALWLALTDDAGTVEGVPGKEPPPRRWLLPDLVPYGPRPRWRWRWAWPFLRREVRGYVSVLVGLAGTKKSYLLNDFGVAAVTDGVWCGQTANRIANVLYVDCELDAETFWARAYEVARGRGLKKPPKGLHYLKLTGTSLASYEGWERIRQACRRCKAEAILIDSITIGAFTVTTNDAGAMNRLFGSFEQWGVPVFAIDHLGKDPARGAVGSFMKYAKIRSEVTLRALRGGVIQFTHSKTNFGAKLEDFRVAASFVGGRAGQGPLTVAFAAAPATGATGLPPLHTGTQGPCQLPSQPSVLAPSLTPLPVPVLTPPTPLAGVPVLPAPALVVQQAFRTFAESAKVAPHPLPVLMPPPTAFVDPPHLAWLKAQPDPSLFVDAATIHAATPGGMTKRRGNEQLKALWLAGLVERQGSQSQGYLYRPAAHSASPVGTP